MEQENTTQEYSASGTPLRQISQDRFNQLRIPQSPSLPAYLNENVESHSRRGSDVTVAADVKAKIAFLNNLSNSHHASNTTTNGFAIPASPTRSPIKSSFTSPTKSHSRANSTVSISSNPADLTNLVQALHTQLEQSRNRERLVAERVESMMEQLANVHMRARHDQQHSDKEVKSMKKQVHKAELALLRCQTELEEARKEQEGFKMRAEHERQAKEKSRRDAFERARTLASNIEELEVVKRERDLLMGENEALKSVQSSMQIGSTEEPVAEMREAGVQARLDTIQEDAKLEPHLCAQCGSTDMSQADSNVISTVHESQEELAWVKSQLKRERDLVHFMNMQCQFRACPCRTAEMAGFRFVHDHAYDRRQQELATAKGLKRKAEDELPLPRYITLRERLEQKSREREYKLLPQEEELVEELLLEAEPELEEQPKLEQEVGDDQVYNEAEEDLTLHALPRSASPTEHNNAGVISLDEAADIPLPSPRSDDLEPTALLEDMTQVMVEPEPSATAQHFAFSTSTTSRRAHEAETPILRQSHSAMSNHDDLFDLAPPTHLPPRPSTVMGLRTVGSPIRMVPPSPQHRESMTPSVSPPRYRTVQVPLKESPLRNSVTQRRSQSRPGDRSRARSPTPGRPGIEANSPSAETYFPVTPKQKYERPIRDIQTQPHAQLQALHRQTQSQTTTTMVPLRGLCDDDVFSPDKSQTYIHANTQPPDSSVRGRQPLSENDPNILAPTVLPGTPITREAALAQIRARRDRARSVASRKQTDDDSGRLKTPKSAARRGVMLNREMMSRDISNLSQASAPARF